MRPQVTRPVGALSSQLRDCPRTASRPFPLLACVSTCHPSSESKRHLWEAILNLPCPSNSFFFKIYVGILHFSPDIEVIFVEGFSHLVDRDFLESQI